MAQDDTKQIKTFASLLGDNPTEFEEYIPWYDRPPPPPMTKEELEEYLDDYIPY